MCADPAFCLTAQNGADIDLRDAGVNNLFNLRLGDHGVVGNDNFSGSRIDNIADDIAAAETVGKRLDYCAILIACAQLVAFFIDSGYKQTVSCAAVLFADDNFL